jgi:DNA replication regulator DPB11
MGAQCLFDLTAQVTHLLIGEVNTPKYHYVAKERPDIKVVLPNFVEGIRLAWMAGDEVDVSVFEAKYRAPVFYDLQICLTGYIDRKSSMAYCDPRSSSQLWRGRH